MNPKILHDPSPLQQSTPVIAGAGDVEGTDRFSHHRSGKLYTLLYTNHKTQHSFKGNQGMSQLQGSQDAVLILKFLEASMNHTLQIVEQNQVFCRLNTK